MASIGNDRDLVIEENTIYEIDSTCYMDMDREMLSNSSVDSRPNRFGYNRRRRVCRANRVNYSRRDCKRNCRRNDNSIVLIALLMSIIR